MRKRNRLIAVVGVIVVMWALVEQLRLPARKRTWHGHVAGLIPYDFRPPTLDRARRTYWAPDDPHIVKGQVVGVGWTLNLGRLARKMGLV